MGRQAPTMVIPLFSASVRNRLFKAKKLCIQ